MLRTAEGFENAVKNGVGWIFTSGIQHKQLIKSSLLENQSRYLVFFTIMHCQKFTLVLGHGARVTVGICRRMETFFFFFFFFFFCNLITHFTAFFSLFPPFSSAYSCAFRMLGHLSRVLLALTGLHGARGKRKVQGVPQLQAAALPKFYTRERSWRMGQCGKMYCAWRCFFFWGFCFLLLIPHFSSIFSLSSLFFCLCAFLMMGHLIGRHAVWGPTHRRGIKERSKISCRNWVNNYACSLPKSFWL